MLFNDALNTLYLQLYGITHMVKDHSDSNGSKIARQQEGKPTATTSWATLLYALSHRQDSTYHGLCYTVGSTGKNEK